MTRAKDIATLLSTANGKIAGSNLDVSFENITDTGTEGTRVATGTQAQRGTTQGQLRFNTDTGLAEYYTGTAFKSIDAPPTVSSIDVTEVDSQAGGNQTIVITGSGFNSGATVTFIGASGTDFNASTVTVDSETQITAVAPKASFLNAQEPYGVKVTNTSGLSATLASQINVDTSPSWNTASGSLGSVDEGASASFSVSATDPDGDTVAYSETGGTVLSTNGLSLNSSTGAITGTAGTVSADTTLNFNLRATANSKTADRAFSIIIINNPLIGITEVYNSETASGGITTHLDSSNNIYDQTNTTSLSNSTWGGTKIASLNDGGNCGNWNTIVNSIPTSGGVTISFWGKTTTTNQSSSYRPFDMYGKDGHFYINLNSNRYELNARGSVSANFRNQTGNSSWIASDWHFYCFRWSGSPVSQINNTFKITVDDGTSLYTSTHGSQGTSAQGGTPGFMGYDPSGGGVNSYNWEGHTGGWRILSSYLSDAQVSYIYNSGVGRF